MTSGSWTMWMNRKTLSISRCAYKLHLQLLAQQALMQKLALAEASNVDQ